MLRFTLLCVSLLTGCVACSGNDLRGSISPSPDGRTYLNIVNDNGGKCGPLTVDGEVWSHPIGQPGAIRPGVHVLACGTQVSISVPAQTVFKFDYWGP